MIQSAQLFGHYRHMDSAMIIALHVTAIFAVIH